MLKNDVIVSMMEYQLVIHQGLDTYNIKIIVGDLAIHDRRREVSRNIPEVKMIIKKMCGFDDLQKDVWL